MQHPMKKKTQNKTSSKTDPTQDAPKHPENVTPQTCRESTI